MAKKLDLITEQKLLPLTYRILPFPQEKSRQSPEQTAQEKPVCSDASAGLKSAAKVRWNSKKEHAVEILRKLDLEPFLDRHPQSLSGGQKQRLAIACALASGRKVILLDEPTSGLDYAHMMETADLLKQLQSMGTTILVVTHDSELIHACCTRQYNIE